MGRIPRNSLLYDGCYAHIISRSIEKRRVFENDRDFQFFRQLVLKGKAEHGFLVYNYCLMHTHYHMAVRIGSVEEFSIGMNRIKWDYTREYNRRHKRRGPLWQNRYKSLLIEDEGYLHACGVYIENNPIRAGLVKDAVEWEYSSGRHYAKMVVDALIDSYDLGEIPQGLDFRDGLEFERGSGIGSDWFKYKVRRLG